MPSTVLRQCARLTFGFLVLSCAAADDGTATASAPFGDNDAFRFETLSDWTSLRGSVSLSNERTEGEHSFHLEGDDVELKTTSGAVPSAATEAMIDVRVRSNAACTIELLTGVLDEAGTSLGRSALESGPTPFATVHVPLVGGPRPSGVRVRVVGVGCDLDVDRLRFIGPDAGENTRSGDPGGHAGAPTADVAQRANALSQRGTAPQPSVPVYAADLASLPTYSVSVPLSQDLTLEATPAIARDAMSLSAMGKVTYATGIYAPVDANQIELQSGAITGGAYAQSSIKLKSGSVVFGDAKSSSGAVTVESGASLLGTAYSYAQTLRPTVLSWANLTFPKKNKEDLHIGGDVSSKVHPIPAGSYEKVECWSDRISIPGGAPVWIRQLVRPGTLQGIVADNTKNPVFLFVESIASTGTEEVLPKVTTTSTTNSFVLVYLGTHPLRLVWPFKGNLFAPNAPVTIDGQYNSEFRGTFFARTLTINGQVIGEPLQLSCSQCAALKVCPKVDSNGDGAWDCDASTVGVQGQLGSACSESVCGGSTFAQTAECYQQAQIQEKKIQKAAWNWSTNKASSCAPEYAFNLPFSKCLDSWDGFWSGTLRSSAMGNHCFRVEASGTCGQLFFGLGYWPVATGTVSCLSVPAGENPIAWHVQRRDSASNQWVIKHCFASGTAKCDPVNPLDANLLKPATFPLCSDPNLACTTACPCASGSGSGVKRSCVAGQCGKSVCGKGNGAAFNSPHANVCWDPVCETAPFSACGSTQAPCGLCPSVLPVPPSCTPTCTAATCGTPKQDGCGQLCKSCGAYATGCKEHGECPTGHLCRANFGAWFGKPATASVCVPAVCGSDAGTAANCSATSTTGALCGKCQCTPKCDGQTCGSDGCGGTCGTCGSGEHCDNFGLCASKASYQQPLPPQAKPEDVATEAAGSLPAAFSVTHDGAARLVVPLSLPPGRGGFKPNLSLVYDSSIQGSETIGYGWRLEGLPLPIERCTRSVRKDGSTAALSFSNEDSFCYGGKRLVPISGANGADGTRYRSAAAASSRFTSTADDAGVLSFEVRSSDGTVVTYKATEWNVATGSRRDSWQPTTIRDRFGNEIYIFWHLLKSPMPAPQASLGSPLPGFISYNHNASRSDTFIDFRTEPRNDGRYFMRSGLARQQESRLAAISTRVGGTSAGAIRLSYTVQPDGSEVVSELRQCAPAQPWSSDSKEVCKPPTKLDWKSPDVATPKKQEGFEFTLPGDLSLLASGKPTSDKPFYVENLPETIADLDGDGRHEVILARWDTAGKGALKNQKFEVLFTNSGTTVPIPGIRTDYESTGWNYPLAIVDWDGDGDDEVMFRHIVGKGNWAVFDVDDGRTATTWKTSAPYPWENPLAPSAVYVIDVDGNGVSDVVTCGGGPGKAKWSVIRLPASGFSGVPEPLQMSPEQVCYKEGVVVNVDEDPAEELVIQRWGVQRYDRFQKQPADHGLASIYKFRRQGDSWVEPHRLDTNIPFDMYGWPPIAWRTADFNGDGLRDLIRVDNSGDAALLRGWLNTGGGLTSGQPFVEAMPLILFQSVVEALGKGHPSAEVKADWRIKTIYDYGRDGRDDIIFASRTYTEAPLLFESQPSAGFVPWGWTYVPGFKVRQLELPPATFYEPLIPFHLDQDQRADLALIANGKLTSYTVGSRARPLLTGVTDGLGGKTTIEYKTNDVYTAGKSCPFPARCVRNIGSVVAQVTYGAELADSVSEEFAYEDARSSSESEWLGFGGVTASRYRGRTQKTLVEKTVTTFDHTTYTSSQDWPYARTPKTIQRAVYQEGKPKLTETTTNTLSTLRLGDSPFLEFPYVSRRQNKIEETQGSTVVALLSRETSITLDTYGNLKREITTSGKSEKTDRSLTYKHEKNSALVGAWEISLVATDTTTSTGPDRTSHTRKASFEYDAAGVLRRTIAFPDEPNQLTTDILERDAAGNPVKVSVTGESNGKIATRITSFEYDSRGIFPAAVVDAEGYRTELTWDPLAGTPTKRILKGKLGVGPEQTSYRALDGFGRVRLEQDSSGSSAAWSYTRGTNEPLKVGVYVSDGTGVVTTFDTQGRIFVQDKSGADGALRRSHSYDALGFVSGISETVAATTVNTILQRDFLGRVFDAKTDQTESVLACFRGRSRCIVGPTSVGKCTRVDEAGRIAAVSDAVVLSSRSCDAVMDQWETGKLKSTSYTYTAFNLPKAITAADGKYSISADYTPSGLIRQRSETGLPSESFGYTAFGEVDAVTAVGATIRYDRDGLGRPIRSYLNESPTPDVTVAYRPDLQGTVQSITRSGDFSAETLYDSTGRISGVARYLEGERYEMKVLEQDAGRPLLVEYPSADGIPGLKVRFGYRTDGRPSDAKVEGGALLWKIEETDTNGQVRKVRYGNGVVEQRTYHPTTQQLSTINIQDSSGKKLWARSYEYSADGRISKIDGKLVSYDEQGRLRQAPTSGGTESITFDALGNVGSQTETDASGAKVFERTYIHGDSARPQLVTEVKGSNNTSSKVTWTADGRLESVSAGAAPELHLAYDASGRAVKAWGASEAEASEFKYDVYGTRVLQKKGDRRTLTFGRSFASTAVTGAATSQFAVPGPFGIAAVVVQESSGATTTEFVHSDIRGATELVTTADGKVLRSPFSAFGRTVTAPYKQRLLGFAGHPAVDELGLVNMGARLYVPGLARFASPDPYVAVPGGAGLNRYAYALNDPLWLTDPFGLQVHSSGGLSFDSHATRADLESRYGRSVPPAGDFDCPAGQWVPYCLGTAIHVEFLTFYSLANLGNEVYGNTKTIHSIADLWFARVGAGRSSLYSAGDWLKPDVADLGPHSVEPSFLVATGHPWILELKPNYPQALAAGLQQVEGYVNVAHNLGVSSASLTPMYAPGTEGIVPAPGGWAIFGPVTNGLVAYQYIAESKAVAKEHVAIVNRADLVELQLEMSQLENPAADLIMHAILVAPALPLIKLVATAGGAVGSGLQIARWAPALAAAGTAPVYASPMVDQLTMRGWGYDLGPAEIGVQGVSGPDGQGGGVMLNFTFP
jgi:RHS repeat-associated protein